MIKSDEMSRETKRGKLFVDIMKGFLDFEKDVYTDITGERDNKQVQTETIVNMLQLLGQNPQIMQDPELMKMFRAMAQSAGIDPTLIPSVKTPEPVPSLSEAGMGQMNPNTALPNEMMQQ